MLRWLQPHDTSVVLAVNAHVADGRDPSWLWDVPYELLRGKPVAASGERALDVAVRLDYGLVGHRVINDPVVAACRALRRGADHRVVHPVHPPDPEQLVSEAPRRLARFATGPSGARAARAEGSESGEVVSEAPRRARALRHRAERGRSGRRRRRESGEVVSEAPRRLARFATGPSGARAARAEGARAAEVVSEAPRQGRESAVTIGLVYPELLGTYGDRGNAVVLVERCRRRGIAPALVEIPAGDPIPAGIDVYLFGGGEDDAGR